MSIKNKPSYNIHPTFLEKILQRLNLLTYYDDNHYLSKAHSFDQFPQLMIPTYIIFL